MIIAIIAMYLAYLRDPWAVRKLLKRVMYRNRKEKTKTKNNCLNNIDW